MADVTIIGAGPGGIASALRLTRAGRRVVVIDKATFPRDKTCGDGLTTNALRRLEALGFDPRILPSWREVHETVFCSPSGIQARLSIDTTEGVRIGVARREELDAALVDFARANGVTVHEGHSVENVEASERTVIITADGLGPIESDYLIAADGMWSPVRRIVAKHEGIDNGTYLGDIHAFRQYFTNVTGPARDELWVWFEPNILPGYVWSFPSGDGGANVGFGIVRKQGEHVGWMKDEWQDILQRPHIRAALGEGASPEGPHKAWPIPSRIRPELLTALGGRVLFVGDAARVVDPLTGEGIGQALETGELAADAILSAGRGHPRGAARRYRNAIVTGMGVDNGFARMLSKIVTHTRPTDAVIRLAPHGPFKGRYAAKWAFEDNPRAGLLTPWRWKERFRDKSGAFEETTEV